MSAQYPGLALTKDGEGKWIIQGVLEFSASYEAVDIRDKVQIEIIIPDDYPDIPPSVKETGGRIPKDFHTFPDGTLCLGTRIEVHMKFAETKSLLGFINGQVIPFLFSFCYWQQYGKMPFGELSHGGRGILEYYTQFFNVASAIVVIELLKILAENNYKGHHDCPCASGKRLRDCHGALLLKIGSYQDQDKFFGDYIQCLICIQESGQKIPSSILSKYLLNRIRKIVTNH